MTASDPVTAHGWTNSDPFVGLNPPYSTIVADPPWGYEGRSAPWRSSSTPTYSLMALDDIKALPVADIAAGDAHLYLWSVLPMMAEAYEVVRAWDFKPETVLTWCKPGPGLGGGFRGNTEHLIVARRRLAHVEWASINPSCLTCGGRARGSRKCACVQPDWHVKGVRVKQTEILRRPFSTTAEGTWYTAPRGAHSVKPELFLDLIERMSPGPYLELFARRHRAGWDVWGDEITPRHSGACGAHP